MRKKILMSTLGIMLALCLTACQGNTAKDKETTVAVTTENAADTRAEEADTAPAAEEDNKDKTPDFTATITDGTEFTLSEAEGKPVLLNFWATWCGPCVEEMPAFQKLYEEYGDKVQILAVDCMEDKATVDAFITKYGYGFPIAYDLDGSIEKLYPTDGIPYTIVIDPKGNIAKTFIGSRGADVQYELYKAAIEEVLN